MNTWQAVLAHIGVSAIQTAAGASYFGGAGGVFANTGIQIGAQLGLLALQGWMANLNSKSDPKGQPLTQPGAGEGYSSAAKPGK